MTRKHIYLITVLIVIVIIYFYLYGAETFVNINPLINGHVQDRVNHLAANTNPSKNPAAPIGITVEEANKLRQMSLVGLNSYGQHETSQGGIAMSLPGNYMEGFTTLDTALSVPISDETSMLAIEKYCKDKDVTTDPFGDEKFNENCGVCMSSGAFTGTPTTQFDGPKGVLVYKADKDRANARKEANNYKYARAMPSLRRAVCTGATSQDDDSVTPTLAIDSDMYRDVIGRVNCQRKQQYDVADKSCGKCMADTNVWSYIQQPPNGTVQMLELQLVGNGKVTITVKGAATTFVNTTLSTITPLTVSLSTMRNWLRSAIQEGDAFIISVQATDATAATAATAAPFIGGLLKGKNADGTIYLQELYNAVIRDDANAGSSVRTGTPSLFVSGLNVRVKRMVPKNPLPTTAEKMRLVCEIPFTFIDYSDGNNNIAYYDCKKGPYVTMAANEIKLLSDECTGQSPGQYSEDCKRKIILDAGCSSAGSWWTNGLPADAITDTKAQITAWIRGRQGTANTDPAVAEGCYGITSVATPCDGVGPGNPPSEECLAYLYKNTSEKSANIGKAYDTTN